MWPSSKVLSLTTEQADEIGRQIGALAEKYIDRREDPEKPRGYAPGAGLLHDAPRALGAGDGRGRGRRA